MKLQRNPVWQTCRVCSSAMHAHTHTHACLRVYPPIQPTYVFGWTGSVGRAVLRRGRSRNRETFQRMLRVAGKTLCPINATWWRLCGGHDGRRRQRAGMRRLVVWNRALWLVLVSWRVGRLGPWNTLAHAGYTAEQSKYKRHHQQSNPTHTLPTEDTHQIMNSPRHTARYMSVIVIHRVITYVVTKHFKTNQSPVNLYINEVKLTLTSSIHFFISSRNNLQKFWDSDKTSVDLRYSCE